MSSPPDLRENGDRIERLLDELQSTADPRSRSIAEELVRLVAELYGAGFARAVELARDRDPELVGTFMSDELLASLLIAQGLHPDSLRDRVERALESVRPFLATHGGDVELLGLDEDAGVLELRLLGSCDGCPSSAVTLQMAVEKEITAVAPEILRIDVDEPALRPQSVPIALGSKPAYEACPAEVAHA